MIPATTRGRVSAPARTSRRAHPGSGELYDNADGGGPATIRDRAVRVPNPGTRTAHTR